jgi:predicted Zn-ribbon and HTH transcriptional regulator
MRCKNCGWPNKPNVTNCVKCSYPLIEDNNTKFGSSLSSESSQPLNKTVREEDVFSREQNCEAMPKHELHINQEQVNANNCPKCGYPLRPNSDKCPNCKFQITKPAVDDQSSQHSREIPNESHVERRRTRMSSGNEQSNNKMRGTINPYMISLEVEPTFVLRPIKKVGERHDFDDQEYEGKEVVLNRDNTDQDNSSITSHRQATITNADGRWFIEDNSDQRTTFVQAAQKIELHEGDIILLGNRLFEFHK